MVRVLIADDEREIIRLLRLYLEKDSIEIVEANDGEEALRLLRTETFDLALIDIMMPKINGFELIAKVRSTSGIPILILSARVQVPDKVFGLELGADDYITKPFDALEVAARVKAALRRGSGGYGDKNAVLRVGDLALDTNACVAYVSQVRTDLTSVEYKVLRLLMESPGRVFTKEQIFAAGWGHEAVDDNTIRVSISRLRDKIGDANIKTIRGLGYRLEKTL